MLVNKGGSFFKKYFIYLFDRERAQAGGVGEGEADAPAEQGARRGTWAQDPRIMTWAEGRCFTDWATQVPPQVRLLGNLNKIFSKIFKKKKKKDHVSRTYKKLV